ncbi:MAG: hypothetical protein AAF587_09620 [Bacteroidota bacterium]
MRMIDFPSIVVKAWKAFDPNKEVLSVTDISAKVSTNHVFRIKISERHNIIAKVSYFGTYQHFREDHHIIRSLAQALPSPYRQFLARSLVKNKEVFTYRHREGEIDVWVVFYMPIQIRKKLPKRLFPDHITQLGKELAFFHRNCASISDQLPPSSKTLRSDIVDLLALLDADEGKFVYHQYRDNIRAHCISFLEQLGELGYDQFPKIPVFVDWNIGNFSVSERGLFFSRWDYDWFRVGTRMMDFYFMSRVVSDIGDKTIFSYLVDPMLEDRFLLFMKAYHEVYPLSEQEVLFLKEVYRFFILHYVINFGRYFFHSFFATRLQQEACEIYLPQMEERFKSDRLLRILS